MRHAISKFAQSASMKRESLRQMRTRHDELSGAMKDLDRQIAVQVVQLRSGGAVELGTTLDDTLIEQCAQLGSLAQNRRQIRSSIQEIREQATTLMDRIRDSGVQIENLRERLEAAIGASAGKLAEQQERIESLEQERSRIERKLCQLSAHLSRRSQEPPC